MKKVIFAITGIILIGIAAIIVRQTLMPPYAQTNDATAVRIAATIPPLATIAQEVAGEEIIVTSILPPGGSPHTFDITPRTLTALQNTQIIFAIGHGLDTWVLDIQDALKNTNIKTVDSSITLKTSEQDHDHHDELENEHEEDNSGEKKSQKEHIDPHYWLAPKNAALIAQELAAELANIDPENAAVYQQRADDFGKKINALEEELRQDIARLDNQNLIVFHESWNYFADAFDLEIVGVFEEAAGKEPSPQQLIAIQERAKNYNIPALFSEPQLSPDVIRPFVRDLGLKLFVLDPLGGTEDRMTYEALMRYNVNTIIDAYTQ